MDSRVGSPVSHLAPPARFPFLKEEVPHVVLRPPVRRTSPRLGRGPIILRFEPLEKREVLSSLHGPLPDLVASSFVTTSNADWNDPDHRQRTDHQPGQRDGDDAVRRGDLRVSRQQDRALLGDARRGHHPGRPGPGQSVPFNTTVRLAPVPLPEMSPNGVVFINLKVDPQHAVPENNKRNNQRLGLGYDESPVQITAAPASQRHRDIDWDLHPQTSSGAARSWSRRR